MPVSEQDIRCTAQIFSTPPYFVSAEHTPTGTIVKLADADRKLPYMEQRAALIKALESAVAAKVVVKKP